MDEFVLMMKDNNQDFAWHQGLLYFHENKLYVLMDLREQILEFCHDFTVGGHFRTEKTLDFVSRNYHWPDL